jgi:hypothetical protein
MTTRARLWWTLAPESTELDPARYLGELDALPEPTVAGAWCDVKIQDGEGVLHWRLVAVEAERGESLFVERRARPADLVRAGTDGSARRGGRVAGPAAADR